MSKLFENTKILKDSAHELWKGNGADIGKLNAVLVEISNEILGIVDELSEEDRITTINYIKDGLAHFENACNRRDDFMLADCLYFEWREIALVYADVLGE